MDDKLDSTQTILLLLKKAKPIISTAVATVADRVLLNPIDTLTVLQQSTSSQPISKIAKNLLEKEGIRGFYKGMSWPLATAIPSRLAVFATYYYVQEQLSKKTTYRPEISNIIAGVASGVTYSLTGCPAEAKRTREVMNVKSNYSNFHYKSLYKGFYPLLARSCMGNTIMLAGTDYILSSLPNDYKSSKWAPFVSGTTAGIAAQVIVTPLDVLKTRVMCDYSNNSIWHHAKDIYSSGSFFNSLNSRMLRMGLGAGTMIGFISMTNDIIDKATQDNVSERKSL